MTKEEAKLLLKGKNVIAHIAAPKSGSTWFDSIIKDLNKLKQSTLVLDYARREQEIQWEVFSKNILDLEDGIYFRHQHLKLSNYVVNFIEDYNVKIVLQVRNIFDSVISMRDHLIHETPIQPHGFVDETFFELSEKKQIDMVIDMIVPWFFSFYASWFTFLQQSDHKNVFIVSYEEMKKDTHKTLQKILSQLNLSCTDDELKRAIEGSDSGSNFTRKNKAIIGRGSSLSTEQRERILKFAGYYPHIDFSIIGIYDTDKVI